MSSRPGALPFFSTLIPLSSSAAVNGLVNPGSSGYRCRSRRTFGCPFGTLPLKGNCIEFKYYADGIHSGLTPPG